MLREHCKEARGVTLPNMMGDRVFNGIFAERKFCSSAVAEQMFMAFTRLRAPCCYMPEDV